MKGAKNADRKPRGQDIPGDKAQDRGQGKGGADSAVENGTVVKDGPGTEVQIPGSESASSRKPSYLAVTDDGMKAALIEARGDLFVASQMLGITALRLNRAVQVSPVLQATVDAISTEGKGIPIATLNAAIEERLKLYRVVGLDALHDLAAMPLDANSAQNQVKLAAAARLTGDAGGGAAGGEMAEALRDLNQLYHEHAPRLRVVREKLTVEISPSEPSEDGARTISGESQRTK